MAEKQVRMGNLRHESTLGEFKPWKSIHKSITMPMITAGGCSKTTSYSGMVIFLLFQTQLYGNTKRSL